MSHDVTGQLMTAVLEGDVGQAPALGYVLDLLGKLPVASRDEARLLHLLHHLNAGRFKEALSVATSIDGNKKNQEPLKAMCRCNPIEKRFS